MHACLSANTDENAHSFGKSTLRGVKDERIIYSGCFVIHMVDQLNRLFSGFINCIW